MMDRYKDHILKIITENGPLGVNALQQELVHCDIEVPVSTLHRYLHKQTYFRMTEDKRWDLPGNVTNVITNTVADRAVNALELNLKLVMGQMEELQQTVRSLMNPIGTIKRGIKELRPAVAGSDSGQTRIDPRFYKITADVAQFHDIMRHQKANIPEEYKVILDNFDLVGLVIKEGSNYAQEFLQGDIYEMLSGRVTELDEGTLQIIKDYQTDN